MPRIPSIPRKQAYASIISRANHDGACSSIVQYDWALSHALFLARESLHCVDVGQERPVYRMHTSNTHQSLCTQKGVPSRYGKYIDGLFQRTWLTVGLEEHSLSFNHFNIIRFFSRTSRQRIAIMFGSINLVSLLLLVSSAAALPAELDKRAAVKCGSHSYSAAAVNAAAQKACSYYKAGTQVGSNDYPHTFNNNEGFSFSTSGPYLEFPILSSGAVYTGGKCSIILWPNGIF